MTEMPWATTESRFTAETQVNHEDYRRASVTRPEPQDRGGHPGRSGRGAVRYTEIDEYIATDSIRDQYATC